MRGGDSPRILAVGESALAVEFGSAIDPAINARVRALDLTLERAPPSGILEAVPTYRSLLVVYDNQQTNFSEMGRLLRERTPAATAAPPPGRSRTIPTLYGGESGPDLAVVARAHGLSEAEAIALHASAEYTCFMLGFAPGFAYLGLLPEALATPRRATPRVRVPAGSVAIAGQQTAIYPSTTAGGWSLLGRTSLRLFDPRADPPALILPGDRVRFTPVEELPKEPTSTMPAGRPTDPALEVLEGGLLTTVQDLGRFGHRRLGVARAGAMDEPALRVANRLLGNPDDDAALECTVGGPTLRFLRSTAFAITGADLGPVLLRSDLGAWAVPRERRVRARAGNVLSFGPRQSGCRAYVAFEGGIDVPLVLGSRATDLTGGFGGLAGRALRVGDAIGLGPPRPGSLQPAPDVEGDAGARLAPSGSPTLRVVLGPQDDHFTEAAIRRLLSERYRVGASSDRVGCRLAGPPLPHRGAAEIVSDGMVVGSIQVPPDGQPIVMMADGPTTGGYPKIATVIAADLPLLAQAVPGETEVRFAPLGLDEAARTLIAPRPRSSP